MANSETCKVKIAKVDAMSQSKSIILICLAVVVAACGAGEGDRKTAVIVDPAAAAVIEVVTLKIKEGISLAEFAKLDQAVETQHVSRQPGYISRESAAGSDREWLVIVHWASIQDADASTSTFINTSPPTGFMNSIDVDTMVMKRYSKPE